jgi:hypothetical protein
MTVSFVSQRHTASWLIRFRGQRHLRVSTAELFSNPGGSDLITAISIMNAAMRIVEAVASGITYQSPDNDVTNRAAAAHLSEKSRQQSHFSFYRLILLAGRARPQG